MTEGLREDREEMAHERGRAPKLSVVVPTHSTRDLTLRCLESIAAQEPAADQILVVDDASDDDSVKQIRRRFPKVVVVEQARRSGFTSAANRGLAAADGELLLLLNSDTEVLAGGFAALRRAFKAAPRLGVAGGQLLYPDGKPQWSGGGEPSLLWSFGLSSGLASGLSRVPGYRSLRPVRGTARDRRPVDWVTGAALACTRTAWREVGPLDESFRFYCQDLDFCLRARRAGWDVAIVPGFQVVHVHGGTIDRDRGSVGRQHPELLWTDLVRWAGQARGWRWARHMRNALSFGAHLRVGWMWLTLALVPEALRARRRRDAEIYLRALRALQGPRPANGS